jgi:hypothetical protein
MRNEPRAATAANDPALQAIQRASVVQSGRIVERRPRPRKQ